MKIGAPKETFPGENRVAMTPESAGLLQKLGHDCVIESKAGEAAGFSDKDYKEAGVEVTGFVRLEVGEGIAKEEEDFAAEVAKIAG